MSVSIHNLSRLALLASNDYAKYEKQAERTYLSLSNELSRIPRAFAYTVSGLMDLEKGYREVSQGECKLTDHSGHCYGSKRGQSDRNPTSGGQGDVFTCASDHLHRFGTSSQEACRGEWHGSSIVGSGG